MALPAPLGMFEIPQREESKDTDLWSAAGGRISDTGDKKMPAAYLPKIFDDKDIDHIIDMDQIKAEEMMRRLASEEGIFCGVSSGGVVAGALQVSKR